MVSFMAFVLPVAAGFGVMALIIYWQHRSVVVKNRQNSELMRRNQQLTEELNHANTRAAIQQANQHLDDNAVDSVLLSTGDFRD